MKLEEFLIRMETLAPRALALDFDNPGLLIGPESHEIRKVLLALDCSISTAKEAIDWGADLVVTHHPIFFGGVKAILPDAPATAAPWLLLRHGIGLFAAHTNLDIAEGGVNDCLCAVLGITDSKPLPPDHMGRFGLIPSCSLRDFAMHAQRVLSATVRVAGAWDMPLTSVAVLGGAGGDAIYASKAAGAQALVTGEIKHHQALEANGLGLAVIEAGHYETERVVLRPLMECLQGLTDDVQYRLTCFETACLRGL
ncbi:MAG: Nif3-like dinuclear metal center hexameric protein [Candidatus Pelethousia sp.]|nr:Nif3-like dinuclear metal center hexameric protein [Candidatus Pelethousia sp.]